MRKIFYANIFCNSLHYPVIDYLINIKKNMKKGDKLILCFWDKNVYNFQNQSYTNFYKKETNEQIKELVDNLSNILDSWNINHNFIFLSDAIDRMLSLDKANDLFFRSLGNISIGYIEDSYINEKYLRIRPITLGKIAYMIMDYLIALFFSDLYPSFKITKIDYYVTGKRFMPIQTVIDDIISDDGIIVDFPNILTTRSVPIMNYDNGKWIGIEMSKLELEREVRKQFEKGVDYSMVCDIFAILRELVTNDEFIISKNMINEKMHLNKLLTQFKGLEEENKIMTIVENLYKYLQIVKESLLKPNNTRLKKINYIRSKEQLSEILSFLNPNILEILKLCDGKNDMKEIIEKSPLKPSSTQSYLSNLRKKNIISKDKKPIRNVNEILISFE